MWLTGPAAPWHVGSSQPRARTRVPCISRQILNHCATKEAPFPTFYSEPCVGQDLGAPARRQGCASEVGEPSSGHWSTRDLPAPRNIKRRKLSQRSPSQRKDPAPLNDQQATVQDTPCQTTSKTGTQPHPLAERLPKIIIRPQTPQNTPPDVDLPTRKTRSSLIHQNTGTSPLHQEVYTTH